MSIIYDALKKTQQARAKKVQIEVEIAPAPIASMLNTTAALSYPKFKFPSLKPFIKFKTSKSNLFVIVTSILLFMILIAQLYRLSHTNETVGFQPKESISQAQADPLILNGIFTSDRIKIAMINDQSFHVGDMISGMKIVDIQYDGVKLKNKNHLIVLKSTA